MTRVASTDAATIPRRMAATGGENPYRVYLGGHRDGKVPLPTKPDRKAEPPADGRPRLRKRSPGERRPKRRNWRRRILIALGLLVLLLIVWGVASYLALREGVEEANDRVGRRARAALTPQDGLLLSRSTVILVLGSDHAKGRERAGLRHSDSMMLLRTDPERNRTYYLSFPRDLLVDVPGYGREKINFAFQAGGAPLALRTVRAVTGIPINHLVVVEFSSFRQVIDALGGIEIDVPKPILSNRFDCPYATAARCQRWAGWRFRRGKQEMDGRRALVYARIRTNRLDPSESDVTRAGRQQQVLDAIADKTTSPVTLAKMPFIAGDIVRPLATDLSSGQLLQLGWVKFRAGRTLRCRLGGTAYGGYIIPDEEKFAVLQMVQGKSAPQPPLPTSPYGSGCFTG